MWLQLLHVFHGLAPGQLRGRSRTDADADTRKALHGLFRWMLYGRPGTDGRVWTAGTAAFAAHSPDCATLYNLAADSDARARHIPHSADPVHGFLVRALLLRYHVQQSEISAAFFPFDFTDLTMSTTDNLKQLSKAERQATLLVSKAREERTAKLKAAKSDASDKLASYRQKKQDEYKKIESEFLGGSESSIKNEIEKETDVKIDSMKGEFKSHQKKGVTLLIDIVKKVEYQVPKSLKDILTDK